MTELKIIRFDLFGIMSLVFIFVFILDNLPSEVNKIKIKRYKKIKLNFKSKLHLKINKTGKLWFINMD